MGIGKSIMYHLTGISTDNAEISIMINKNEVWSGVTIHYFG